MDTLRTKITAAAHALGFDLVGFSPAKISPRYLKAFDEWLAAGHEADMTYMHKIEARRDLTRLLPGARSVIVLATNYYQPLPGTPSASPSDMPAATGPATPIPAATGPATPIPTATGPATPIPAATGPKFPSPGHGVVARYAFGRDYHKVIGKKLKELEKFIGEIAESCAESGAESGAESTAESGEMPHEKARAKSAPKNSRGKILTKSYVDTGPILERALAEQAGLGRIGKNACLITEEFGSWVFLSEIITTLDLVTPSEPKSIPSNALYTDPHFFPGKNLQPSSDFFPGEKTLHLSSLSKCTAQIQQFGHKKFANTGNPANPDKYTNQLTPELTPEPEPTPQPLTAFNNPQANPGNVCGACTRCIQACPTGAIIAPGVIDSRLCISYLTIENRKKIPPALAAKIKKLKLLYGCDICQEVCPHNQKRQKPHYHQSLKDPKIAGHQLSLAKIARIKTDREYLQAFAGSPLMRAKQTGLQRNAKVLKSPPPAPPLHK